MVWPANGAAILEASVTAVAVVVCTPVPVRRMLCGTTPVPPKMTEPLVGPGAMGKKATFCVQDAPAARVIGVAPQEPPTAVVNGPVKAMEATVIDAEPVFASVTL